MSHHQPCCSWVEVVAIAASSVEVCVGFSQLDVVWHRWLRTAHVSCRCLPPSLLIAVCVGSSLYAVLALFFLLRVTRKKATSAWHRHGTQKQKALTINPNDCQPPQLTDQATGANKRAAHESLVSSSAVWLLPFTLGTGNVTGLHVANTRIHHRGGSLSSTSGAGVRGLPVPAGWSATGG